MKIGILDSGIGGLTVLKELILKYPNNQYYYFGDNKNLPYGSKNKSELLKLATNIITFLEKLEVDIIIIACGTISCNIHNLKSTVPLYDVIFPTINYLNNSCYDKIGIIGTDMTINSRIFEKKVNKPVLTKACPSFVLGIERNQRIDFEYLKMFKNNLDVLVLGCTHYPIVADKIDEYFQGKVGLLNMGKILADSLNLKNDGKFSVRLYFSKINHQLIENIEKIIPYKYQLEEVVLEEENAGIARS